MKATFQIIAKYSNFNRYYAFFVLTILFDQFTRFKFALRFKKLITFGTKLKFFLQKLKIILIFFCKVLTMAKNLIRIKKKISKNQIV